jgi:hypothetical protein
MECWSDVGELCGESFLCQGRFSCLDLASLLLEERYSLAWISVLDCLKRTLLLIGQKFFAEEMIKEYRQLCQEESRPDWIFCN